MYELGGTPPSARGACPPAGRRGSAPTFLILLLFIAGCAHPSPTLQPALPSILPSAPVFNPSPYQEIPAAKTLRQLSQFEVVDDFNNPELKNQYGEPWEFDESGTSGLGVSHVPQDALQEKRGHSLLIKTSLDPHQTRVFKSSLRGLDMSQAQALVLKCRMTPEAGRGFLGKLELQLKDTEGQTRSVEITPACLPAAADLAAGEAGLPRRQAGLSEPFPPNGWREALAPRPFYAGTDWNKLDEIALLIHSQEAILKAEIAIDELAFYGARELVFESQKDNLVGFPERVTLPERVTALLEKSQTHEFLREISRDTWRYFENALDEETQLPLDHLRIGAPGGIGAYTSPTNIAMYLLACVSAHELGFISKKEAVGRIEKTYKTLRSLKRWKGFHYNFYNTRTLQVTRNYVSTVDSGWLAAAWIVIRQAFPKELGKATSQFLNEIDFYELYDPGIGHLHLGYDEDQEDYAPYHYGMIATEARVTSLIGIGKGDLSREHWWYLYRTPPDRWAWQSQKPQGRQVEIERVTFFQGYYTYQGRKFVPSWGGSLFEFLMPTLLVKEKAMAPASLGRNNRVAVEIQIDYALNRKGYPVWGISPAATASGRQWRYKEFGVPELGVKGYRDMGVVTPHASFLALDPLPEQALDNLRRMLQFYPDLYGEYGFYDALNLRNGKVNPQYLTLDQGMSLVAATNYLTQGAIQEYFHQDEIVKKTESLLTSEEWFK